MKRLAIWLLLIVVLLVGVPLASIEGFCRAPSAPAAATVPPLRLEEAGYKRNGANTYFTFPEWYIVYSFEDFGKFLDTGNESGFPYLTHITGFWTSFCAINRIAGGAEKLAEVKTMIYVIGISYSVELAIKALYENTIGRVFEWVRGPARTPEDDLARAVAQEYGAFLYTVPWYKFPFWEKVRGLWAESRATTSPARSIERKLALSAEYGVKTGYAWVIQKLLDATSDPEAQEIMLVVPTLPPDLLAKEPRIRVVRALDGERKLIIIPRYKAFTEIMKAFARAGQGIAEIAGNHDILVTAALREGASPTVEGVRELFSMPIVSRPGFRRAGFDVKVARLSEALRALEAQGVEVEHVYDY